MLGPMTRHRNVLGIVACSAVLALGACSSGDDGVEGADPSTSSDSATDAPTTAGATTTPAATSPTSTPASTPTTAAPSTPPLSSPGTKAPPQFDGATTPATGSLYAPGTIDTALSPWIDAATADLADRLGVDPGTIPPISAVLVSWPDSSIGCPQPGMQYLQVVTDGAVIELEADGAVYRYHGGGDRTPFLCPTPITAAPPAGA